MQKWSRTHAYAVSKKSSKKDQYVFYACDRRGAHITSKPEVSQRERHSQKCGCEFLVAATSSLKKTIPKIWSLKWKNSTHNHEPADADDIPPIHRRLNDEEFDKVQNLANTGVKSAQILDLVRKKGSLASVKTIYNARGKVIREKLGGLSPIECMFECIQTSETWINEFKKSTAGVLQNFFLGTQRID